MTLKHILVHLDASARTEERLALAVTLARRHGARLTGLFSESGSLGPGIVGQRDPAALSADVAAARTAFEARTAEAGTGALPPFVDLTPLFRGAPLRRERFHEDLVHPV